MFKSHLEVETKIPHTRCKGNGMVVSVKKTKVMMIKFIAEYVVFIYKTLIETSTWDKINNTKQGQHVALLL